MTKNLLFDLGGVLIDLDVQRSLNAMHALTDGRHQVTEVTADGLLGGHDSELINLYQTGDITTEEFVGTILKSCKEGTTRAQVEEAWFAMLLGIKEEKRQLLQDLKDKGYGVYVLSNINELHVQWTMEHCPELKMSDGLFFSNEIHLSKPDPRCYSHVLANTGIRAEETLYIDDLRPNIEAGKEAGFRCMHVTDEKWVETVRRELL